MKYTALGEGLVTNIALSFASCDIFATRLSPQAVYFIQTGSSALSNTYSLKFNDSYRLMVASQLLIGTAKLALRLIIDTHDL